MSSPRALASATPPGLPGSSTDLSPRAVPSHPGKPKAAVAHCFTSGVRLHRTRKTGHFPFALTGPDRVRYRCGSRVRLPGLRQRNYSRPRRVSYLPNEQLQGKLLSAYKISQACPAAPGSRFSLILLGYATHSG